MAPPTSELAINHPDWLTQQRDGKRTSISAAGEVVWMNPFHPEVQQLLTGLVLEVISRYPVDGVQFDDHLSLPVEFGYDTYARNLYYQETGKPVPADPHNPEWVQWRADKITAFVQKLNAHVRARRRQAIFAIAVNPYDFAYKAQLQDWLTWVREDLVDELVVQIYRDSLHNFRRELSQPSLYEARQKIPTGVGILAGLRNQSTPLRLIKEKVETARRFGVGTSFFYYESLWDQAAESVEERQQGFQDLFQSPMMRIASN